MNRGKSSDTRKRRRHAAAEERVNESDNESLDEENELTRVKIGKIPYGWYDEFKHFGYDKNLHPVLKEKQNDKI
ncbi:unnamed protein product [Sphagnum balticum]